MITYSEKLLNLVDEKQNRQLARKNNVSFAQI